MTTALQIRTARLRARHREHCAECQQAPTVPRACVGARLRHANGGPIGRLIGPYTDHVCGRLAVAGQSWAIAVWPGLTVSVTEVSQTGPRELRRVSVCDFPAPGCGWWVIDTDGRGRWWHTSWESL